MNKCEKNTNTNKRKAKIFYILFECTLDISYKEQMSQIIKLVEVINGKYFIRECFIDFIITKDKTG